MHVSTGTRVAIKKLHQCFLVRLFKNHLKCPLLCDAIL